MRVRIIDERYEGGVRLTIDGDTLRSAIERAYGLPVGIALEAVFGTEVTEALLEAVRITICDVIEDHLSDLSADTLYRHMKSAEARAVATAQI